MTDSSEVEPKRSWSERIGEFIAKMLSTAMMWAVHSFFIGLMLWWVTYKGYPEVFDLPSPSMLQIVGIAMALGFVKA